MSYSRSLTLAKSRSKVAHEPPDISRVAQLVVPMYRSARQFDLIPELGELAGQLAHPMHDRLAAGSEPAAGEADRVTQLAEGSVVVAGFGRTGLPGGVERGVNASELLEEADVGAFVRRWLHVLDELLELGPTIRDPRQSRPDIGIGRATRTCVGWSRSRKRRSPTTRPRRTHGL